MIGNLSLFFCLFIDQTINGLVDNRFNSALFPTFSVMTPKNTTHVYLYYLVTGYNMNMGYEWFQLKGIFRGLEGLKYPVFHLERNS